MQSASIVPQTIDLTVSIKLGDIRNKIKYLQEWATARASPREAMGSVSS